MIRKSNGFTYCALGALLVSALSQGFDGKSAPSPSLKRYLAAFYRDSARVMNEVPPKIDAQGNVITRPAAHFGIFAPNEEAFLKARNAIRSRLIASTHFAAIPGNDLVENLVEVPHILRKLGEMEAQHLTSQELARQPWSDSYWPLYKGMIANRYADPAYPAADDWETNQDYILKFPAPTLLTAEKGDELAPSEKYDYLMGDDAYTLTQGTWDHIKSAGTIASWEGICDGWSAAAAMSDEPLHGVTATGADGRTIRFFPSDINALSSLLWSKGTYPANYIGSRCEIANPPRDPVGRVISPECFDINPGTWHMSVVNQIGVAQRALVIDATHDAQIWNYPLWKYHYTYFNPQTLEPETRWADAVVPYDRFTIDKFRSYRSPDAKFVVGISMNITYSVETQPSHDEGVNVAPESVNYVYDLELDKDETIIGGEWYSNIHPDFIWTPRVGARAISDEDPMLGDPQQWDGMTALPPRWVSAAPFASQLLQPMAAVVERLVKMSRP